MQTKISIPSVMSPRRTDLNVETFKDKNELFHYMSTMMYKDGKIKSVEGFMKSLYEREELGPTYMGNCIAIPHGKSESVNEASIAFCRCRQSFRYESGEDSGDVNLAFMLAIPIDTDPNEYLSVLAKLASLLIYDEFIDDLYKVESYDEFIKAIYDAENNID